MKPATFQNQTNMTSITPATSTVLETRRRVDGVTTVKADLIQPGASAIAPKEPLRVSGLLDRLYEFDELTPALGRTYPTLQLRDLLHHEKADELIRDLAIVISRRGVVFFKNQDL